MSFLLFPHKFIIDHGLRLNTRQKGALGQPDIAILVVVSDIYLDFKRILIKKALRFTELSLNKTTKQEIKMRDNSGHSTSQVCILQEVPETRPSQKSHPGLTKTLRNI